MTGLGLFLLGVALLVAGGELFVKGSSSLAKKLGLSPMLIGLTVVAFGTSAPELAVSVQATLAGNNAIAVSNVVGSNIFNLLFILGLSALVTPLSVEKKLVKMDLPIMLASAGLLWLMIVDENLSRAQGLFLLALFFAFLIWQFKADPDQGSGESDTSKPVNLWTTIFFILCGLSLLVFGADLTVKGATSLAKLLDVSDRIIGILVVAAGTSLPELATSVMAGIRGERDIAIGNVVGSNILNILVILGASAAMTAQGLLVDPAFLGLDVPFMVFCSFLALPFFMTGKRLSRLEGGVFLILYSCYAAWLIFS